ncbi:hypothetical protein FOA52_004093 [Chlamydomonas sp. UWO 241]|nr:hypothetical protein FOA52_004093 [Chlamydomonas sp. UWO 241]
MPNGVLPKPPEAEVGNQQASVEELLDQALELHQDTTAAVVVAARIALEASESKDQTLARLETQNRTLTDVRTRVANTHAHAARARTLLRYMGRRCCCSGQTDPEASLEQEWQRETMASGQDIDMLTTTPKTTASRMLASLSAPRGKKVTVPKGHRQIDTKLPAGYEGHSMALAVETRAQDEVFDVLDDTLDELRSGANEIASQLSRQDAAIEGMTAQTDDAQGRIKEVSTMRR